MKKVWKFDKRLLLILLIVLILLISQKGFAIYKTEIRYYSNEGYVGNQFIEWKTWESTSHFAYYYYSEANGYSLNDTYESQHEKIPFFIDSYWETIPENDDNYDYSLFLHRLSYYDFMINVSIILLILTAILVFLPKTRKIELIIKANLLMCFIINTAIILTFSLLFPKWGQYTFFDEREINTLCIEKWHPGLGFYLLILSTVLLGYLLYYLQQRNSHELLSPNGQSPKTQNNHE